MGRVIAKTKKRKNIKACAECKRRKIKCLRASIWECCFHCKKKGIKCKQPNSKDRTEEEWHKLYGEIFHDPIYGYDLV